MLFWLWFQSSAPPPNPGPKLEAAAEPGPASEKLLSRGKTSSAPVPAPPAGLAACGGPSTKSSGCRDKARSVQPQGCSPLPPAWGGGGGGREQHGPGARGSAVGVLPAASSACFHAPYGKEPELEGWGLSPRRRTCPGVQEVAGWQRAGGCCGQAVLLPVRCWFLLPFLSWAAPQLHWPTWGFATEGAACFGGRASKPCAQALLEEKSSHKVHSGIWGGGVCLGLS